jgi:hypothetical protein
MARSCVGIFYVLWLSNLLLLGDGAPERGPLSISSSSFLNFPKQNFFQFILVLEDVPRMEDEPAELQRENKQNMVENEKLISRIESRGNMVNIEISIS